MAVRANLLPDSILQLKAAQRTKSIALVSVAAGAVVVLAGLGVTMFLTTTAQRDLDQADNANTQLVATQRTFSEVSTVLNDIDGIQGQLGRLLTDDVSVGTFLGDLRAAAPEGISLSSVNLILQGTDGTSTDAATVGGSGAAIDDSGLAIIGSLDFTGSGPNEAAIAQMIDSVGAIPGLTVPYVVSIREDALGGSLEFTAQATVTEQLRSERFITQDGEGE